MQLPFGHLEVIVGPMFSGKSTELLRRLKRATIAGQVVLLFKPSLDDRYAQEKVVSHDKIELPAIPIPVDTPQIIFDVLTDHPEAVVVGIDEVQFFIPSVTDTCRTLTSKGIRVIVSGLDMDYLGQPFGSVPELMAIAERVDKLTAVCTVCGADATRTQRLTASTELVDIGAGEKYTARCIQHFTIPETVHADTETP